jgi:hypothetical protein
MPDPEQIQRVYREEVQSYLKEREAEVPQELRMASGRVGDYSKARVQLVSPAKFERLRAPSIFESQSIQSCNSASRNERARATKTFGWHERLAASTNQSYDEPYRAASVYRRGVGSVIELPYAALGNNNNNSQVMSQQAETRPR